MLKSLLPACLLVILSAPAFGKDAAWYVSADAGLFFGSSSSGGNANVDFTTTPGGNTVGSGFVPPDFTSPNAFKFDSKTGIVSDVGAGYDFGTFRLEGELGYKHARISSRTDTAFLSQLNSGLNRPSAPPDPGAPGLPALTASDFARGGSAHAWSAMLNALLDLSGNDGIGALVGGGVGYANVHAMHRSSGRFAWQAIASLYYPMTADIDIGLKARYFSAGSFAATKSFAFQGNTNRLLVGQVPVDETTNAVVSSNPVAHFKGLSLLASLTYNFGAPVLPSAK